MLKQTNNRKQTETYEVLPDETVGGWKVQNSKGTCLQRTTTKREAVWVGQTRARNRSTDSHFGSAAVLVVRRLDGTVEERRQYAFQP